MGEGRVDLAWSASADNGGGAVRYLVDVSPAPGGGQAHEEIQATQISLTGLQPGANYTVTVTPVNDIGGGQPQSAQATPFGRPSPPQNLNGSRNGPNSQTLTWTWNAPADNGGRQIIGYDVSLDGGAAERVQGGQWSRDFNWDTQHTLAVRAVNEAGLASDWVQASASTPPQPPPPDNRRIDIHWGGFAVGDSQCPSNDCKWGVGDFSGFQPNNTVDVECWEAGDAAPFATYRNVNTGSGNWSGQYCFYGQGGSFYYRVNGVESNRIQRNW